MRGRQLLDSRSTSTTRRGQCALWANGQHAQRAFVKDVIGEVCRTCTMAVAAAQYPAHDHQANGGVEKAVRDVKDQLPRHAARWEQCRQHGDKSIGWRRGRPS